MHELAIIKDIIDVIQREASLHGIKRVHKARLKIGRLAAIQPEQLKACLAAYDPDNLLQGLKLEVEEEPVELECRRCGSIFGDARFEDIEFAHCIAHAPMTYLPSACPKCESDDARLVLGNGIHLVEIDGE